MLARDSRIPSLMKEKAVLQHPLFIGVGKLPQRAAAQVRVAAKPLVAARRGQPSRRADAVREIRFIPFSRHECLIEGTDRLDAFAANDPGTNDAVDFLQSKPVPRARANRALQPSPVHEIVPRRDRIGCRGIVQPATEAQ